MNLCTSCHQDFTSVAGFDKHRVGVHAYTLSEGLRMDPIREDGRRCLTLDELRAKGFEQNERGQWFETARRNAARKHFGTSRVSPNP